MYCGLWPANRSAFANPCADVPWHQVQFWMMAGDTSPAGNRPPANAGMAEGTIARIAIFKLISFIIPALGSCFFMRRRHVQRGPLPQRAEVGREGCDL